MMNMLGGTTRNHVGHGKGGIFSGIGDLSLFYCSSSLFHHFFSLKSHYFTRLLSKP